MEEGNMAVARFRDGRLVKGYVRSFSIDADTLVLREYKTLEDHRIPVAELKAVFFVKSFDGCREHREDFRKQTGRKAFVKFGDKETLVGFVEGDIPWDKEYARSGRGGKAKGFILTPVDRDGNNEKIFVVGSAIQDMTIIVV